MVQSSPENLFQTGLPVLGVDDLIASPFDFVFDFHAEIQKVFIADLMNVLYAGYANPISISVPGVPANAISASMTGGSFVRRTLPAFDMGTVVNGDIDLHFGWVPHRWCMVVVSSCREMLG